MKVMFPEYISLIIAALGFIASVYYSGRKAKEDDVDKIKKETERDASINFKLDRIMQESTDTVKKVDNLQKDIDEMKIKNATTAEHYKELEKRMDRIENQLGKLHKEHRENQQRLINCYDPAFHKDESEE